MMQLSKNVQRNVPRGNILIPTEQEECITFYEWACLNYRIRDLIVHFANEGKRTFSFIKKLKKIGGLPKGFPDFCIFLPNEKYHSLFIEMKTREKKYKKQKKEQVMWRDRLLKVGHYATFTFGCDEAIQITKDYLDNKI